jgi:hypothetical protein
MKHLYLLFAGLLAATTALAQTTPGGVRIGTAGAPDAAAALDINATGKGLLIPRMDSAARAGIAAPPDGLMVFQTDGRKGFWYCVGGAWLYIPDKTRSGDNLGNHRATQNIVLNGNQLVGGTAATPGTVGLRISSDGLVRIGSTSTTGRPLAGFGYGLRLDNADGGLLATGTLGYGVIPASGAGLRLMWHPFKASLRAGEVSGAQWDDANVGFYSYAFGNNVTASSFATFASGDGSTASGTASVAMGASNTASGTASVALGASSTAGGFGSLAVGYTCRTTGQGSVAVGYRALANNDYAVAIGQRPSSNGFSGVFVAADASSTNTFNSTASNQFSARYAGGYRLLTNTNASIGVQIVAGGNSWTVISDSTKKELRRLADGNQFLARLNRLPLGSWNYKGQDARTMRHYGPMAQDFYAAFGHDGVGTIGNDTTINQSDFDGVNLIALQALYRRVLALEAENAALRRQQAAPAAPASATTAALEERLRRLEALVGGQAQR